MWRVSSGEVVLIAELSVVNLRARDGTPKAHLSIYDVRYAPGQSPGSVAFLREFESGNPILRDGIILTDSFSAAAYIVGRLKSAGWGVVPLDADPRGAHFIRTQGVENAVLRITSADLEVAAEWIGLYGPVWGDGPSANYRNHHQWAFVLEASEARLLLNGARVDGEVYPDERFRTMFGAPLSSAQIGLAEVHVDHGA